MPDGRLVHLGGHHQAEAMRQLGESTIPARVVDWDSLPRGAGLVAKAIPELPLGRSLMILRTPNWFSFSPPGSLALACAGCGETIDLGFPAADHHPARCPHCARECAFLAWKGRTVQIVPDTAPPAVAAFLRWSQTHLDELEYVELLVALEEMSEAMSASDSRSQCPPSSRASG